MVIRTKYCSFLLLLLHFLIISSPGSVAQNAPVTTAATVGNAVPGAVDVPLTVTGFTNIGAVSLAIEYDYSVIQFTGGTPNPLMTSFPIGDLNLGSGFHRITMGWFATGQGLTLSDGSAIMTLHFIYISGNSMLQWNDNGPSCEYTDLNYNVLNDIPTGDFYINGLICGMIEAPGAVSGPDTLCQGTQGEAYSIAPLLNATGYNWTVPDGATIMSGQGTNLIIVDYANDAMSGDVSVYALNTCGSGPSTGLYVSVYALPLANSGPDQTIPFGTSTTLSAVWPGGDQFTFHWSPEELLIDPDVQDPQTVNMTQTAIFSVVVTNQNSLCQNSDKVTVTVTGGPLSVSPIAIPASICRGESSQLYSNAGGGSGNYTYQWSSVPPGSPPWSSTLANPLISPDSSRLYLLLVNDGFSTDTGSVFLFVSPPPSATISGGDTLCGENVYTILQVDLTGIPPWSFTYSYGSTSVFIANQQLSPYFINAYDPGDYIITSNEDENCTGASFGMATVRKYPIPATPEITVNGYDLISGLCCGNQWYMNGTAIPGATDQIYHVLVSGQYFDIITLNNCSSDTSDVADIIVGIDETTTSMVKIYPNPANTQITIQTNKPIKGGLKISLCSAGGIVIRNYFFDKNQMAFTIDINGIQPGLYLLMCSNESMQYVRKLIIR